MQPSTTSRKNHDQSRLIYFDACRCWLCGCGAFCCCVFGHWAFSIFIHKGATCLRSKGNTMTTITMKEVAAFLLGEAPLDGAWFGDTRPSEHGQFWWRKHLRAALAAPATAPEQKRPINCGTGHCSCIECVMPDGPLYHPATAPEQPSWKCKVGGLKKLTQSQYDRQPDSIRQHYTRIESGLSWQDAPTEPGMWACLYMGELSTAIFNAYEIEHFDRDEMVGCRWRFIPEDKQ